MLVCALRGIQKSLWLLAIAASCWTMWLSRNSEVFERAIPTLEALLFHSKMRAFLWTRAVHKDCIFSESDWWTWPRRCGVGQSLLASRDVGWDPPPVGWIRFNVAGVDVEDVSAYDGVLGDNKGVMSALFSVRDGTGVLEKSILLAIKEATEMIVWRMSPSSFSVILLQWQIS